MGTAKKGSGLKQSYIAMDNSSLLIMINGPRMRLDADQVTNDKMHFAKSFH